MPCIRPTPQDVIKKALCRRGDLQMICCGRALLPPWGLVYGCAAADPPGPPYTLYILPHLLKGCRRKVRINMLVEVRDMVSRDVLPP